MKKENRVIELNRDIVNIVNDAVKYLNARHSTEVLLGDDRELKSNGCACDCKIIIDLDDLIEHYKGMLQIYVEEFKPALNEQLQKYGYNYYVKDSTGIFNFGILELGENKKYSKFKYLINISDTFCGYKKLREIDPEKLFSYISSKYYAKHPED